MHNLQPQDRLCVWKRKLSVTHAHIYIIYIYIIYLYIYIICSLDRGAFFQVCTHFISASFHIPFRSWSIMNTKERRTMLAQLGTETTVLQRPGRGQIAPEGIVSCNFHSAASQLERKNVCSTWFQSGLSKSMMGYAAVYLRLTTFSQNMMVYEFSPLCVWYHVTWLIEKWLKTYPSKRTQTVLQGTER